MAIVNCPECNEQISTSAKKCIHCGAELTFCPECEKVYVGKIDVCEECGFIINQEKENKKEQISLRTARIAENNWKNENSFVKYKNVWPIITAVLLFLVCFFVYKTFKVWAKNPGSMLVNYSSTFSDMKTGAVLGFLIVVFGDLYRDLNIPILENYIKWIKSKGGSLKHIINDSFSQDFSKMTSEEIKKEAKSIKYAIDAEIINSDIEFKNKIILDKIIDVILGFSGDILMLIFLLKNFEVLMNSTMMKSDLLNIEGWSISKIVCRWQLVLGIVILIISAILNILNSNKEEKRRKKWIETNMPENLDKYEQYIVVNS